MQLLLPLKSKKVLHILGVSVVLGMQHAMRMHHVIHGLSVSTVFCHIILQMTQFSRKSY
jgi:uncharacterized membrane protein